MGWFGDFIEAVVAPVVAPVKAVVNIVSGGNVLSNVAGAALGTQAASDATLNAVTGGNLGKLPIIGSPFQSATNIIRAPTSELAQLDRLRNLGYEGIVAVGVSASGLAGGIGAIGAANSFKSGNYLAGLSPLVSGAGFDGLLPYTDILGSLQQPNRGLASPGFIPTPVNNINQPPQNTLSQLTGLDTNTLIIIGLVGVAGYFILKKEKVI